MNADLLKNESTPHQYHIDRISPEVLSRGLRVGILVLAVFWLILVGSSWA